jgi:hypothetical protein
VAPLIFLARARTALSGTHRDEERHEAWLAHREHYMENHRPRVRPGAWWRYEAPKAPDRAHYRGRYDGRTNTLVPDRGGTLTTDEYELARLRFLASQGLLSDDEIFALLAEPKRRRPDTARASRSCGVPMPSSTGSPERDPARRANRRERWSTVRRPQGGGDTCATTPHSSPPPTRSSSGRSRPRLLGEQPPGRPAETRG